MNISAKSESISGKILFFAICFLVLSVSCSIKKESEPKSRIFFDYFDTVTYINSYGAETEEEFERTVLLIRSELERYNSLLDAFNSYPGLNNLYTINENAGKEVEVCPELIDFLEKGKELYGLTGGEMNIMAGSLTGLWRQAGEESRVPSYKELVSAASHTGIDGLCIDRVRGTVMLTDPLSSADAGATGKGYVCNCIAKLLRELGKSGYVINIGGNLCVIGDKNGEPFTGGIRNPSDLQSVKIRIKLEDVSCVTSGNYERYYTVDGMKYNHIIDMDTLYPARFFDSVTVIHRDSCFADALSTALFCMSFEDGKKAAGNEAVLWIFSDGSVEYTDSFAWYLLR